MIVAHADFGALQRQLAEAARKLGEARAQMLAQRGAPARWRKAALLWPLSSQE